MAIREIEGMITPAGAVTEPVRAEVEILEEEPSLDTPNRSGFNGIAAEMRQAWEALNTKTQVGAPVQEQAGAGVIGRKLFRRGPETRLTLCEPRGLGLISRSFFSWTGIDLSDFGLDL